MTRSPRASRAPERCDSRQHASYSLGLGSFELPGSGKATSGIGDLFGATSA
jgi:hypothetical protein